VVDGAGGRGLTPPTVLISAAEAARRLVVSEFVSFPRFTSLSQPGERDQ
jgi:hypothetical protein